MFNQVYKVRLFSCFFIAVMYAMTAQTASLIYLQGLKVFFYRFLSSILYKRDFKLD